jgi:hypothetical protein
MVAGALLLCTACEGRAEQPLRLSVTVRKLDGFFSTYSVPAEGTTWTFDLAELTAEKKFGKIEFMHPTREKDRGWYFPYSGGFRVVHREKDSKGWKAVRLVNEWDGDRATISLQRLDRGNETEWRGFLIYERADKEILGALSFGKSKS